jgi:hypothetical protein
MDRRREVDLGRWRRRLVEERPREVEAGRVLVLDVGSFFIISLRLCVSAVKIFLGAAFHGASH